MSTARQVERRVSAIPPGEVFTYDAFSELAANKAAVAQSLSRMVKCGTLKKLGRGKFYRPKQGRFGELPLLEQEQLRPALRNGYITGTEAFNRLGLTTQISAQVVIAAPGKAYATRIGDLRVKYVRAQVPPTSENAELLMILDALKQIRRVPDASPDTIVSVLLKRLKKLNQRQATELVELGKKYQARVRALLGAMLEATNRPKLSARLKETLNPLTTYKAGVRNALPNSKAWNLQ